MERPKYCEDKHLAYMDRLRQDGPAKVLRAKKYLCEHFNLPADRAENIVRYWTKQISIR